MFYERELDLLLLLLVDLERFRFGADKDSFVSFLGGGDSDLSREPFSSWFGFDCVPSFFLRLLDFRRSSELELDADDCDESLL
jgi:hypothetical protein